ncbi:hypothetical protein [Porphyromonas endodontalis]|uniref:hypothetical protein n=1 Tax=Porphyromonas endodontalis TaxID=28124 RepID=UPI0028EB8423|nr:hypothetical protein [Porphyromonas endodontalis]
MSNYTKIVIRLLAAMAIVGSLGACADRGAKNPQDALTASVNASSVDGELRAGEISSLRVISSAQNYNKLLSVQSDQVNFRLPTNEKQTLFFLAGERDDLGALRATEFNQKELNTQQYFGTDGKTEPKLYVGTLSVNDGVNSISPITLTPTYAKLSYKIRFLNERRSSTSGPELRAVWPREVTKVWIAKVPPTFSLGGVKTYYTCPATDYKTFELGKDKTGVCYLPEHDPSDVNNRTYIGIEVKTPWLPANNNLQEYYVVVHEPYDNVNYGKIIRGRHYNMTITLPVKDL